MSSVSIDSPLALLGGLSPAVFMRRHWQRKPLLVRQAVPDFVPPVSAKAVLALAAREDVQSRLIVQTREAPGWQLRHGPFKPRALPPARQRGWTVLVQGVDLHDDGAHALLQQFAFIPQARLDDLMISVASDGGGVGPHFDSYDVFLLQAQGRRRWRIGRQKDLTLQKGVPLRILQHFEPEEEWVLEPGDMLYLPPGYAHDGIAEGDGCMTYSIGFRSPQQAELATVLLERLAEPVGDEDMGDEDQDGGDEGEIAPPSSPHPSLLYRDAGQAPTAHSGAIPPGLQEFAREALAKRLAQPHALEQILGEYLSEPAPGVYFDASDAPRGSRGAHLPQSCEDIQSQPAAFTLVLNRKTRLLYDARFLYVNGESYRIGGKDARLLRQLADARRLAGKDVLRLSQEAREVLDDWLDQGWMFLLCEEQGA